MSIIELLDKLDIKHHNEELIAQAFVHSSYANEHKGLEDNERLEFIGDAVVQIYSADKLYHINPALKEGQMTTLRAKLVCEETLAIAARKSSLVEFLKLGEGEKKTHGDLRDSITSDMFEALTGAIYLDSGIESAFKFLDATLLPHLGEFNDKTVDYKTKLQEYVQADSNRSLKYTTVSETGPKNSPMFEVEVSVDGLVYGKGVGTTKKEAEKMAAKDALNKLVK